MGRGGVTLGRGVGLCLGAQGDTGYLPADAEWNSILEVIGQTFGYMPNAGYGPRRCESCTR